MNTLYKIKTVWHNYHTTVINIDYIYYNMSATESRKLHFGYFGKYYTVLINDTYDFSVFDYFQQQL